METDLFNMILEYQQNNINLMSIIQKFNPLIQKHKKRLNYEEAETDLKIALIEILSSINLEKFNCDGSLVKFISNSMSNKSIDLFRKYVVKENRIVHLDSELLDIIDKTKNTIDNNIEIYVCNKIQIEELLTHLSVNQKRIIIEKYFKYKSDSDIAKHLNISRQAVNKTKNQSLKKLKKYIIN